MWQKASTAAKADFTAEIAKDAENGFF